MRVAGIERIGAEVTIVDLPDPRALDAGEVLIEVRAAGVANWDEFVRTGGWDVGGTPPMALGVAAAGEVLAVGPDVTWPAVGDGVMTHPVPLSDQGCWAPRLIASAAVVAPKPSEVSWAQAAAFPVPALTAEQVLSETLSVRAGEWLLVHGAGGVTGKLIVALAASRGVAVIATASSRSEERVKALGARVVLDYHDADWPSRARDAAGPAGILAAVNAAPEGEPDAMRTVADGGRLATITGAPPPAEREIDVTNVYVRADGEQLRRLAPALADGTLPIDVAATYPLARAAEALAHAVRGAGGGAVALELP